MSSDPSQNDRAPNPADATCPAPTRPTGRRSTSDTPRVRDLHHRLPLAARGLESPGDDAGDATPA